MHIYTVLNFVMASNEDNFAPNEKLPTTRHTRRRYTDKVYTQNSSSTMGGEGLISLLILSTNVLPSSTSIGATVKLHLCDMYIHVHVTQSHVLYMYMYNYAYLVSHTCRSRVLQAKGIYPMLQSALKSYKTILSQIKQSIHEKTATNGTIPHEVV